MAKTVDINLNHLISSNRLFLTDSDAIKQALLTMFDYRAADRMMRPYLASPLRRYLHRPVTESTASQIMSEIQTMVNVSEPRVRFDPQNSSIMFDSEEKTYYVTIAYIERQSQLQNSVDIELEGGA